MKVSFTRAGATVSFRARLSAEDFETRLEHPWFSLQAPQVACAQAATERAVHAVLPQLVAVLEQFDSAFQVAYLDLLRVEMGMVAKSADGSAA